ncbi:hypothetical protein [Mesorhizobium sp. ES1-1]|uniref:hypothetical protein n=1 Tax=Mesorhizobium sp. ES1-1 TaxID=2876629 RepID=UPI001CCFCBD2|nr:hypothetical protein [Mesorhizobium sp. ES1-1]MBZ9674872.1 hypothetical protein [Mesorhizobium sp. ES1-1]
MIRLQGLAAVTIQYAKALRQVSDALAKKPSDRWSMLASGPYWEDDRHADDFNGYQTSEEMVFLGDK